MSLVIYQVDAFTDTPFAGNPAGVCLLPEARDDAWMQAIGGEMNLSETAFLVPNEDGFDLRWFTPSVEVDLCGHATLASAHVLWQQDVLTPGETARFHTRSGLLTATRQGDWIELDFPATPPQPAEAPAPLIEALRVKPRSVARSIYDYLVEVESEEVVRGLAPDFGLLAGVGGRGVMVTSVSSDPAFDFVSRFFGPAAGIDEDPVTGSAHCCLGPFWGERLGKREMVARQVSARGGVVRVRLGPAGEGRVYLSGQAVTVMRCELYE
jgi:PhzF family phenazine biosynthesis protein